MNNPVQSSIKPGAFLRLFDPEKPLSAGLFKGSRKSKALRLAKQKPAIRIRRLVVDY